jgi:hypothetical protein
METAVKSLALINTQLRLFDEETKIKKAIEKRREQLESAARASGEKKFKYYMDEKRRNKEKYEAVLEKARADFEKYDQYCDKNLEAKVDEDADKTITGYKFELKSITEQLEQLNKDIELTSVRHAQRLKEERAMHQKEVDAQRNLTIYGTRHAPKKSVVTPVTETPKESNDDPHPIELYNQGLYDAPTISIKEQEEKEKKEKEAYLATFESFKFSGGICEERKQKARQNIENRKKFESDIRPLLTPDEIEVFDDPLMESGDKNTIYPMSLEDAKKAIQDLAPNIKKVREFVANRINLSSEKLWDVFDSLKLSYKVEVVNKKGDRNDKEKLLKKLDKK